jgi:hypothetical protein
MQSGDLKREDPLGMQGFSYLYGVNFLLGLKHRTFCPRRQPVLRYPTTTERCQPTTAVVYLTLQKEQER